MPDFLVSAATGALSPILHKLAALLGDEYKRFKGVRGEVEFLIQELEAMHAFLLKKSEEENPHAQDKAWMKEVRELSYDIEDSLDDFRVRVDDDSTKPDGFIEKCKKLLQLDKTKARRQIAKEIEKLNGQVKVVSERNQRYKICEIIKDTSNVTVDLRALAILKDASRLVGIDGPKQEVISFLMKDNGGISSSQQPKIVSIVGIGGIGKTTLANRVYEELKDQFEYRAFLSVSRNPDIFNILRTILSNVTGQPYYKTEAGSIQQLIMEINNFLRTKRYLIVVDDVWDVKTWDAIKYALPNNICGNAIITTTRIHDVAEACCSLHPDGWVYKPKPLQKQDSKRLFQNRIFGPKNECPEYLEEVSDKILKKCGGLPLAIIAISGLLANKTRNGVHLATEWDQVQTSIGHGLERDSYLNARLERDSPVKGMMEILSLSYFDLSSHLKACLLYLSTFPEDYEIEKDRLVRLWVAEGFVRAESTCTLYESGEKCFNELINRNLVLPWEMSKRTCEVHSCRVHDIILDFIVHKSTEDNFVRVHGIPRLTPPEVNVRRLSLQGETEQDMTLHPNLNYTKVRSIVSFGFPCSLLGFRFLRVLDFSGCWELLENHHLANIGKLLLLRYLGLSETRITELPEQIGALQYLETLDLRACDIIKLPAAIVRLKRLVNLLMGPGSLKCFPSGIKNMQALEGLNSVEIDIKAAAIFVEEIGYLTKMRHLDISFFSSSNIINKESYVHLINKMVSSFRHLNKLLTLVIQFSNYGEKGHAFIFCGDDTILEVPWCSASLRKLVFEMNPMSRVPSWMKSLLNIEELVLRLKKLDQESLCILGDLPALVELKLQVINVEDIPSTDKQRLLISNRHGYRSLRNFIVDNNSWCTHHSIPMLKFEVGSMPKLEVLRIDFDADITISVSNGRLDFGLNHLSQLTEVRCMIFGNKLNIWRVKAAIRRALDNHPKLPCFPTHEFPSTEGERSNRERLRPRRRRQSAVHATQPKPSSIAVSSGQEVVQEPADEAVVVSPSGAAPATSDVLGPRLIPAPQQQGSFVPPCFTFSSVPMDSYEPSQHDGPANAFSSAFNSLTLRDDHPGSSATAAESASSDNKGDDDGNLPLDLIPVFDLNVRIEEDDDGNLPFDLNNNGFDLNLPLDEYGAFDFNFVQNLAGAAPATSDVLGRRLVRAPHQQQGSFVPPCFTFGSGSAPKAEAERQGMDSYEPSQHDGPANEFSKAFNSLSLRDDHPGSSATAVEAASSDIGSSSCQEGGRQQQQ